MTVIFTKCHISHMLVQQEAQLSPRPAHHMVIKQFLLLYIASYGNQTVPSTRSIAAEYRYRRWVLSTQ